MSNNENYISAAPTINALLNPNGSITTFEGNVVAPANESGAESYKRAGTNVNKFLNPDGSIHVLSDLVSNAVGTLGTNNLNSQTVPANPESFMNNILLHKVSKTGSYSDLLDTPTRLTDFEGILPLSQGGTNASTANEALINLGLTATASELNTLDGITATTEELNYCDGVTSSIQTQIDEKANTSHMHSTDDVTSGTLPIARGGTGGDTATVARTNLEVMKETTLYENASGTQSTLSLSDSAANYDYLEIYFCNGGATQSVIRVYSPSDKTAFLSIAEAYGTNKTVSIKTSLITISGTSITWTSESCAQFWVNTSYKVGCYQRNIYFKSRRIQLLKFKEEIKWR